MLGTPMFYHQFSYSCGGVLVAAVDAPTSGSNGSETSNLIFCVGKWFCTAGRNDVWVNFWPVPRWTGWTKPATSGFQTDPKTHLSFLY